MQHSSTSLRCQALPLWECGRDSVFTTLESNLWLEKSMVPTSPAPSVPCSCFSSDVLHHQMNVSSRWMNHCHLHVTESIRQPPMLADELQQSDTLGRSSRNRMGPQKNCIRGMKSQTQLQWQTSNMTTAAQLACVFAGKPFTNTLNLAPISCTLAGDGYHSCPYMVTRRNRASDCVLQFMMQQAANCGM